MAPRFGRFTENTPRRSVSRDSMMSMSCSCSPTACPYTSGGSAPGARASAMTSSWIASPISIVFSKENASTPSTLPW